MSSRQEEEEPGPSGLTTQETLTLLGLNTSDSEREEETAANSSHEPLLRTEEMADSDEDDLCQEALDCFERQRAFQTHLLQQSGGGLDARAKGAFEFKLDNYVDRRSKRMGVRERHFNTQPKGELDSRSKHHRSPTRGFTSSRESSVSHHA